MFPFKTFIIVSTLAISLAAVGGIIGFIVPLLIFHNAQAGFASIIYGAPAGIIIGMPVGITIGVCRSEKNE